jgi:flagellar protein FlbD
MIRLTRLNQKPLVVNAEFIKFVEETPDTVITLRDNEKVLVKDSADEVIRKVIEYGRALRWVPGM